MRLYFRPQTGRPVRVAWLLHELGVDFRAVALSTADMQGAEHRARHPLGWVPVLEFDDGRLLFESTAIVLDVTDLYPESGLIGPPGSSQRAEVYEYSIFAMTELERTVLLASKLTTGVSDEFKSRQHAAFVAAAQALAERQAGNELFLGDRLSAADFVVGGVLAVVEFVGLLDAVPDSLAKYWQRCKARDAYQLAAREVDSLLGH